jgi:hypothetical protein
MHDPDSRIGYSSKPGLRTRIFPYASLTPVKVTQHQNRRPSSSGARGTLLPRPHISTSLEAKYIDDKTHVLVCRWFIPRAVSVAHRSTVPMSIVTAGFRSTAYRLPLAANSITMHRSGGTVQAPMKRITFGWRSFRRSPTSRMKSVAAWELAVAAEMFCSRLMATSVPCQLAFNTSPNAPCRLRFCN